MDLSSVMMLSFCGKTFCYPSDRRLLCFAFALAAPPGNRTESDNQLRPDRPDPERNFDSGHVPPSVTGGLSQRSQVRDTPQQLFLRERTVSSARAADNRPCATSRTALRRTLFRVKVVADALGISL